MHQERLLEVLQSHLPQALEDAGDPQVVVGVRDQIGVLLLPIGRIPPHNPRGPVQQLHPVEVKHHLIRPEEARGHRGVPRNRLRLVQHQLLGLGVEAGLPDGEEPLDVRVVGLQDVIPAIPCLVDVVDVVALGDRRDLIGVELHVQCGLGVILNAGVPGAVPSHVIVGVLPLVQWPRFCWPVVAPPPLPRLAFGMCSTGLGVWVGMPRRCGVLHWVRLRGQTRIVAVASNSGGVVHHVW
mmetsp:Transcript_30588/g.51697  ORF Transcript_30588/g.51697 Transcript_30588/m.51697 type:complete len:239 (-) Transcript_30588:46-762(-)